MRTVAIALVLLGGVSSTASAAENTSNRTAVEAEAARIRAFNRAHGLSATNVPSAPQTPTEPSAAQPTASQTLSFGTHTVAKGETLYSLSKRFGVSVGDLQAANGLSGNTLAIGQTLRIPVRQVVSNQVVRRIVEPVPDEAVVLDVTGPDVAPQVYAVPPKDTLYAISRRTCLSVDAIAEANDLKAPYILQPGQRLNLPDGHCLKR